MKTTHKRQKLLAKYHIICQQIGMTDEDRRAHLERNYGVSSSRDLTDNQLIDLINKLLQAQQSDANIWRRRVMAAIGAYLRRLNLTENAEIIKSIACRASCYDDFNKIPVSRLRAIYYEFVRQNKTRYNVQNTITLIENTLAKLN